MKHPSPHAILRPALTSDMENLFHWRNHPEVRKYMYSQHEIAWEEHQQWFTSVIQDPQRILLILDREGMDCGCVNFSLKPAGNAIWGFYLSPEAPKGSGKLLGKLAIDYAFDTLQVESIIGEVLPDNTASIRFHTRHGFALSAIIPQVVKGGRTVDNVHQYVLTQATWRNQPRSQHG